ncbi:LytR/AlgR family response regulator transcription factor [Pedobacter sp. GR22-6]|uniref:LytR/AlgR family response regulator transcription factor n=1 Tax=Pedobacter sp. GR22-6 TaxID=3127957 RepID=UPI00307F4EAA
MKIYKAIVVDDETHALDTLSEYINKSPNLALSGCYENPLDALNIMTGSNAPDVAFLDIDMPELSGLSLAEMANSGIQVIFVSAHEKYALEAFNLHPAGYLLKPFSFETFLKTATHVCRLLSNTPHLPVNKPIFLKASVKGTYIQVMSQEIKYVEAMLNYVKIYTTSSESPKIIYHSMKSVERKLGGTNVIRVSRSFIINTVFIKLVEGNRVILKDGTDVSIGQSYKDNFFSYLDSNTLNN